MRIVSIHQPYYFPYLGFFEKILRSDVFVFLNEAQYEKNNFYNRNRIRTKDHFAWITVPVNYKYQISLNQIGIENKHKWQVKHFKSIYYNYLNSPFYDQHKAFLNFIYREQTWDRLIDLNSYTLKYILNVLGVRKQIIFSSELNLKSTSTKRLVDICKEVNADVYLSGSSGKKYLDEEVFRNENIKVVYQNYRHPKYKQVYGGFEENLSVLDLLLNHGPKSKDIILKYSSNVE